MVGGLIKPVETTQLPYLFFLQKKKKKCKDCQKGH